VAKTRHDTADIVAAVGWEQPALAAKFGRNACIIATRVVVETFRQAGVKGTQPLAVHVEIYNPAYAERIENGEADAAATDPKCWSAQLGFTDQPQREGEEDLHVVAIVEDTLLIDMTLNQASAPEHGVVLTPGFFPIPGEFSKGGEAGKFTSYVNGSAVTYVAHPDEKAYLSMPHWTNRTEYEPFVKSALARLESS
jgi:hypothetical protein